MNSSIAHDALFNAKYFVYIYTSTVNTYTKIKSETMSHFHEGVWFEHCTVRMFKWLHDNNKTHQ